MSSFQICLNNSVSLSSCNIRRLFNLERHNNAGKEKSLIKVNRARFLTACLNVDVEARSHAGKIGLGTTMEVIEAEKKYLVGTYARTQIVVVKGKGCKVYDVEGREYLDMTSGIAVNSLGYGDEDWLKAVVEQASNLIHISNIFYSTPQVCI